MTTESANTILFYIIYGGILLFLIVWLFIYLHYKRRTQQLDEKIRRKKGE